MEQQQVAGVHEDRHAVGPEVGDLDVAGLRPRSPVGDDLVDRLPVRSRHDPERSVVGGRRGDGQPRPHLVARRHTEVPGVLVPRLSEGAPVLEDELREEAVDVRPQQVADEVDHLRGVGQVGVRAGDVVEAEHLADPLLGPGGRRDGDRPGHERLARRFVGEAGHDDEAVPLPDSTLVGGQGGHGPPR